MDIKYKGEKMNMEKIEGLTFEQLKELEAQKQQTKKLEHEYKMIEYEYYRETKKMEHGLELERQRIFNAEKRKFQERKEWQEFGNQNRRLG